uniref:Uncharacterized protein n=1 Tax=Cyclopterus lumpus TaxID=8103 RepID=A0A8C2X5H3_CYCLU
MNTCFFSFSLLFSLNIQAIKGDDILRDLQKWSMCICHQQGGEMGLCDDVYGLIILDNWICGPSLCKDSGSHLRSEHGLPKELRYYYEFIQKVLFLMHGENLSPQILGLKNNIYAGL